MRREPLLLLVALTAGCATLVRPDGDGGWAPERRSHELAARAEAAGVALDGAPPPAPLAGPIDLSAALALASGGNRRILEAERLLDAAGARVRDARGRLLPSATGSGRYTWYTDTQSTPVSLPAGLLPPGVPIPDVLVRDDRQGVLNGTVALPLDLSGELRWALRAAQAGYRGERARRWATTLDQHAAVVRAYFGLLEAERLVAVSQRTLAVQQAQLANAEAHFAAGRVTRNEVLVVQVALAATEQEERGRRLAADRARWTLNALCGLDVDAPTRVRDVTTPPALPDEAEVLRTAYADNPVLLAIVEEQQRLEAALTALVRSRLPRISGGGAIDYTTPEILRPQTLGSGFLGFAWDLGLDGRREAQIAEARLQADRNRLVLERELRGLEGAVREARGAVDERLGALAAAERAVVQADENLRLRRQQFDVGRATSEDVLDAEALLAEQEAVRASALYQAHARRAELEALTGRTLEPLAAATR